MFSKRDETIEILMEAERCNLGKDIYSVVDKDNFRPDHKAYINSNL